MTNITRCRFGVFVISGAVTQNVLTYLLTYTFVKILYLKRFQSYRVDTQTHTRTDTTENKPPRYAIVASVVTRTRSNTSHASLLVYRIACAFGLLCFICCFLVKLYILFNRLI